MGPSLVIYHGEVNEDSDGPVEAATPISPSMASSSSLPTRIEPAHREACTTVTRAQVRYPGIVSAYDAVERWILENGKTVTGPPREVYFADPSTDDDNRWPISRSPLCSTPNTRPDCRRPDRRRQSRVLTKADLTAPPPRKAPATGTLEDALLIETVRSDVSSE